MHGSLENCRNSFAERVVAVPAVRVGSPSPSGYFFGLVDVEDRARQRTLHEGLELVRDSFVNVGLQERVEIRAAVPEADRSHFERLRIGQIFDPLEALRPDIGALLRIRQLSH